jgi:hypothetical protein
MGVQTGTSVVGFQNLNISSSAPTGLWSLTLGSTPAGNPTRYGYYYLFQYSTTTPFQRYLMDAGAIYAPGMLKKIPSPLLGSGYNYFLQAYWDYSGLVWTSNIA